MSKVLNKISGSSDAPIIPEKPVLPIFTTEKEALEYAEINKASEPIRRALKNRMKELMLETMTVEKKALLEEGKLTMKEIHQAGELMNLWELYGKALHVLEDYKKKTRAGAVMQAYSIPVKR